MTQRKLTKVKTFQYRTICSNEVLNLNLRFNSLYFQNLFEEHKIIVNNILFSKTTELSKPKPRMSMQKQF